MSEKTAPAAPPLVVIDLGKHKPKSIKKLRKGEGELLGKVKGVIDELRLNGTIGDTVQPVVIVVREKEEISFPFSGLLR